MAPTPFDRYGGSITVRKIVSKFYDRVLDSESLRRYLSGVEMRSLIDHQTKFVATVMGGPASYSDEALRRIHQPFGISRSEFNEVTEILRETLEEFEVESSDINEVMSEFHRREPFIVTRPD